MKSGSSVSIIDTLEFRIQSQCNRDKAWDQYFYFVLFKAINNQYSFMNILYSVIIPAFQLPMAPLCFMRLRII